MFFNRDNIAQPTTLFDAKHGHRGAELMEKLWDCHQNLEKTEDFVQASGL